MKIVNITNAIFISVNKKCNRIGFGIKFLNRATLLGSVKDFMIPELYCKPELSKFKKCLLLK